MKKVQEPTVRKTLTVEPTVRKTLTVATSRIPWQPLISLAAVIVVISVVVLSGQELKHVPPAAPTFTVLYSFAGPPTDGAAPGADLIRDAAGNLYGTTVGGGASGNGVVFKLSPTGTETVLHSFAGADGSAPVAGLIRDAAGNLYGTTSFGGAYGNGAVFKLSPSGTETVLHNFTGGADGARPIAGLVSDAAGNLYGTTYTGGKSSGCLGLGTCGVVFRLSPTGTETVLHSFTGGTTDGGNPAAGLIQDAAGNLDGTTLLGGSGCPNGGFGTVFKLSPCGSGFNVLHSFEGADGAFPQAGLLRDAPGNLYGTAHDGGAYGPGVVFKLSPTGTETVLYNFTGGADGAHPDAGLVQDAAGNLYGTADGGPFGGCGSQTGFCGVLFKVSPTGTQTVLHSFTGGADGGTLVAGLIQDAAGNLYGTTQQGGASTACQGGCGVVFRLAP